MERFIRPSHFVGQQDKYTEREVGLTHPDNSTFFRLRDNGDIELIVNDGLGMVFHQARRTITMYADTIKFLTKEDAGLRWNNYSFNPRATSYSEPAFLQLAKDEMRVDLYEGMDEYLE